VATVGAGLSVLSTAAFLLVVHVGSYGLPPPPKDLAVGTAAPEFTLPDEAGNPVTLASLRGRDGPRLLPRRLVTVLPFGARRSG